MDLDRLCVHKSLRHQCDTSGTWFGWRLFRSLCLQQELREECVVFLPQNSRVIHSQKGCENGPVFLLLSQVGPVHSYWQSKLSDLLIRSNELDPLEVLCTKKVPTCILILWQKRCQAKRSLLGSCVWWLEVSFLWTCWMSKMEVEFRDYLQFLLSVTLASIVGIMLQLQLQHGRQGQYLHRCLLRCFSKCSCSWGSENLQM